MKVLKEKPKTTYVVFLLDNSVSMQKIRAETISGFNEQLEAVKQMQAPDHEVLVSLVTFSTPGSIKVLRKWNRASEVKPISLTDYKADGGGTALLDAMQYTISLAKEKQEEIEKNLNAGLVIFFTDGEENASVEVKKGSVIKEQIEALRETKHWTFTFTGTKEANVVEKEFGISSHNTTMFAGGAQGMATYTAGTISGLHDYTRMRNLGSTYSDNFYDSDKSAAVSANDVLAGVNKDDV